MKLELNAGDWATIALFALGTVLGCYAQSEREQPAAGAASATTARPGDPARMPARAVARK